MENSNTKNNGTFIIALSRTLRTIHQKSETMLRQHHLTMAQFAVLEALHHKGALTVGALIESVLSTSGNMTVVIRNLEQNGLVRRMTNTADRRSFIVCLTNRGEELITDVFAQHMMLVEESLSPITQLEQETIIRILKKLQSCSPERRNLMEFYEAMKQRRSRYHLTEASTVSDQKIEQILADAITYTPSAFHSQSSRAALLFGERHQKLWEIVLETLRAIVPTERFAPTEAKIASFAAGHGTILFFEDMATVETMQTNVPSYADNFPLWSLQSAGMLQYAVWTALSQEGLGASLQHYNPLIDTTVQEEFGVPKTWKLLAQMPFGTPGSEPDSLTYLPVESRMIVQGGGYD